MKKTIYRDLVFTAAEVQQAICYMLNEKSQPVPKEDASVEFKLSEHGAQMAWTDVYDEKV